MTLADFPAFTVIGATVRTTNADEMSGNSGRIGPLWNQFMHGGDKAIPGVIDQDTTYAIYANYESNATGAYDLTLGKSVQTNQKPPAGMTSIPNSAVALSCLHGKRQFTRCHQSRVGKCLRPLRAAYGTAPRFYSRLRTVFQLRHQAVYRDPLTTPAQVRRIAGDLKPPEGNAWRTLSACRVETLSTPLCTAARASE